MTCYELRLKKLTLLSFRCLKNIGTYKNEMYGRCSKLETYLTVHYNLRNSYRYNFEKNKSNNRIEIKHVGTHRLRRDDG